MRMRARVWARRNVYLQSFVLQQLADAENMVCIADRDATVHVIGAHNHADSFGGLGGIGALSFGDEIRVRNPAMHQVIVPHAAFAVTGVGGRAASGDDYRSEALLKQIKRMVKTEAVHRGGSARILGSAEDDDGVRGMNFLSRGLVRDSHTGYGHPKERGDSERSH